MKFYEIFIDSVQFFYINVFMYALFLGIYGVVSIIQSRFGIEFPFGPLFLSGICTFIAMFVWINLAHVWYARIKDSRSMMVRALSSELPLLLLVIFFLMVWMWWPSQRLVGDTKNFVLLLLAYLFLFPATMYLTKSHKDKVDSM